VGSRSVGNNNFCSLKVSCGRVCCVLVKVFHLFQGIDPIWQKDRGIIAMRTRAVDHSICGRTPHFLTHCMLPSLLALVSVALLISFIGFIIPFFSFFSLFSISLLFSSEECCDLIIREIGQLSNGRDQTPVDINQTCRTRRHA
jgi:hypothetical protein